MSAKSKKPREDKVEAIYALLLRLAGVTDRVAFWRGKSEDEARAELHEMIRERIRRGEFDEHGSAVNAPVATEPKEKKPAAKKKLTEADRLKHDCPHCGARAGFPCTDYKGRPLSEDSWREPFCQERGRPEVTAKKLAKKAKELNAKALKAAGGGNSLLTYLHGSDVALVTPQDLAAQKLHADRLKENSGHAEHAALQGLNWILMGHLRREAARLIGAELERVLWDGAFSCHGAGQLDYIVGRYRDCLCTTKSFALGYERRFDPARVKTWYLEPNEYRKEPIEMKNDGWYVVPTETWPPEGYAPVMTREEFSVRFKLHHLSVSPAKDLSEPDDGGLFERTIGVLKRAA